MFKVKRIRVYVEGCLDASLVDVMLRIIQREYELPVDCELIGCGEKRRVMTRLMDSIARGIRAIAFVDSDTGIHDTENQVKEILSDRKIKLFELTLNQGPPPHINILYEGKYSSTIIMWAKPPEYQEGTIEDLLCRILDSNTCGKLMEFLKNIAIKTCTNYTDPRRLIRWLNKITPLIILTLCLTEGTLIWDPSIRRCGFKVIDYLEHLILQKRPSDIVNYIRLLHEVIQKIILT